MSLSGHVHHLPHLLAYMTLSFLLMGEGGGVGAHAVSLKTLGEGHGDTDSDTE